MAEKKPCEKHPSDAKTDAEESDTAKGKAQGCHNRNNQY
jgi:hypothetical protein